MAPGWHQDEGGRDVVALGLHWDHARGHGSTEVALGSYAGTWWHWDEECGDVVTLGLCTGTWWHQGGTGIRWAGIGWHCGGTGMALGSCTGMWWHWDGTGMG